MKILVTGGTGLVGSRFVELHSNPDEILSPSHEELDITQPRALKDYIATNQPDVVINFSAFTDVTAAENQRGQQEGDCWRVNVDGVKNLLSAIDPLKTHFIQISTDLVFPGSNERPGPYAEDDKPEANQSKLSWYGYSKSMAEQFITTNLAGQVTILRLIYPVRAKFSPKLDYLRKPLKLFDEGKLYPLFSDQQVSISFIDETCALLEQIILNKSYGSYHSSSRDTSSPLELVTYLLQKTRDLDKELASSSIMEFLKTAANPTRYPIYGGLSVDKTQKVLDFKFSTWKEVIDKLVSQGISPTE